MTCVLSFQQGGVLRLLLFDFTAAALRGCRKLALHMRALALRVHQFAGQLSKLLLKLGDLRADLADMILPAGDLASRKLLRLCVKRVLFLLKPGFQCVEHRQNAVSASIRLVPELAERLS